MYRWIWILVLLLAFGNPLIGSAQQDFGLAEIVGRGRIDDVLWLPDGRLAVFGARGIWVYETITPNAEPTLIESPYGWIRSAAIGGGILATGHQDGSITVWDAAGLTELAHVEAFGSAVNTIAITPDGARVAAGSSEQGVQVWETSLQSIILDYGMREIIDDVAISPDGLRFYVLNRLTFAQTGSLGNASQLDIIDIAQPANTQRLEQLGGDFIENLAVSPDGRWVALPGASVLDTQTGELIYTYIGAPYSSVAFFTDQGMFLYSELGFSTVDTATWSESDAIYFDEPFPASAAAFSNPWVAVIGSFEERLRLWNRESGEAFDFLFDEPIYALQVDGDQVSPAPPPGGSVLSVDGRYNAVWSYGEDQVQIQEVSSGDIIQTLQAASIQDLAWSDTHFAAITSTGVTVWAIDTWEPAAEIALEDDLLNPRLALRADRVVVWDNPYENTSSGECIGCPGQFLGLVLYTAGLDEASLQKLVETDVYTALDVAVSPDSMFAAVGGSDGQVHMIDLETGEEVNTLAREQGAVNAVLFDPAGRLITGHDSGLIQIWTVI